MERGVADHPKKRARPKHTDDGAGAALKRVRRTEPGNVQPDAVDAAQDNARSMRVPPETVQYFEEISAALDQAAVLRKSLAQPTAAGDDAGPSPDPDEQALLVSGALGEAVGQQVALALDPVCSRVLQRLLSAATAVELLTFTGALAGRMLEVVTNPFGSHVLETLCEALRACCAPDNATVDLQQVAAALTPLCDELAPHATRLVVHPAASPALRVILSCLSGRDVRPGNSKGHQELVPHVGEPSARAPKLLRRFASAIMTSLESGGEGYWSLVNSPAASALLQSLCLAHVGCPRDLDALLPRVLGARCFSSSAGGTSEGALAQVPPAALLHAACDPAGSRLLECVLRFASPPLRLELAAAVFTGNMATLAQHPCGNFALQAYLRALRDSHADATPLSEAFAELSPCMTNLLRYSRGGVVAALLDACARTQACEREASRVLAKALAQAYGSGTSRSKRDAEPVVVGGDDNGQHAGAAMVVEGSGGSYLRDLAPSLLRNVPGGTSKGGFSHQGCVILTAVLSLTPPAGRKFADSMAALPQAEALSAAQDAAASRCVETVLRGAKGNAPLGIARKLATTLSGHWATLGCHPVASHVVDAAFDGGDVRTREAIVAALAGAVTSLAAQRHGPALMARLGVSEFKRDPAAWKRRHVQAAKVQHAFIDILRDEEKDRRGPERGSGERAHARGAAEGSAPRRAQLGAKQKSATSVAELSKEVQRALAGLSR